MSVWFVDPFMTCTQFCLATYYVVKNECKYGLIDSINTVMNNPIFFVLFDHAIKK